MIKTSDQFTINKILTWMLCYSTNELIQKLGALGFYWQKSLAIKQDQTREMKIISINVPFPVRLATGI